MALEEMKMGGDDPDARRELESARTKFTAMLAETQQTARMPLDPVGHRRRRQQRRRKGHRQQAMVALLNRRSYIRNLVRDVNAALDTNPYAFARPKHRSWLLSDASL